MSTARSKNNPDAKLAELFAEKEEKFKRMDELKNQLQSLEDDIKIARSEYTIAYLKWKRHASGLV